MKPLFKVLFAAALATATTGCKDFLDINDNPNVATSVTPDALLANALVTTAAIYTGGISAGSNYNSYASFAAGYWGKSGTVSGFSQERTYIYSTTYYQALWNNTYDNLNDYQQIQNLGGTTYPNHAAIARIMKVYNYLLLVDEYGDIPYTNALKGLDNTNPTYDKAADIYKDLVVQLKGAVADINTAAANDDALVVGNEDVVFGGGTTGMLRWKRFANSLRLRILLRESSTNDAALNAYVATEMNALRTDATDGFIDRDVVVQPSYTANTNQQNPFYDRYGFAAGATRAQSEYSYVMPTNYIIRQYLDNNDPRIAQLYRQGQKQDASGTTATAAYVGTDLGEGTPPQFNPGDCGCVTVGSRFLQGGTFLRSATAPTVLMLLSEHLFSKSEAEIRGLWTGTPDDALAQTDYQNGILASFVTTYRDGNTAPAAPVATNTALAGVTQYNTYMAANTSNGLVNWAAVSTTVPEEAGANAGVTPRTVSKTDKILYQKYLAENTLASVEAWDDYRRTAQPKFKRALTPNPLPNRLFYPQTEVSTNLANIPTGVTSASKIFWDVLD
ncbi:SusD/RagB family nutrient-binding outer membrane lipoprotein [Hymenobacter negativus]|uniref:SusD/RagB family nutrient-binding outer membrane lipoprotein n=1 Tax=Hymenobacter negativus TaxID=2795026 RepID=A0ABS3QJW6_9BACT|nr:SusD/RagB family nutrient-binding outer membrane lipoprotein [Hymenobacter negativus]MBO2011548.1 SusD/RagB family nutrient-binding outer membrane lipoprotein [Hymenobacter negativus]